jgi:hypothetical protein
MRRWVAKGIAGNHFVEWNGKAVASVKTAMTTRDAMAQAS